MARQSSAERSTLAYQPSLDGLRCLAVLGVVCAHASAVQPVLLRPASYMYVDMFFVISGYLITTLLLGEHFSTGRFSLKAFYVRRITRLYPVILMILAIMVVSLVFWPDAQATPSWLFAAGTAFYFSNFVAISNHADSLNAWISLWSLSIEEQFYAIWPIALLAFIGRTRRLIRPLGVVIAATVAMWIFRSVSIHRALHANSGDPSMQFQLLAEAWHKFNFSTFQRPDGLLIGCAVALVLAHPEGRMAERLVALAHRFRLVALAVIVMIIWATDSGQPWQVYWGLAVFNICTALLLVELLHYPGNLIARTLTLRPFVWVGRRSYFIYATHLAIFTLTFDVLGLTSLPDVALIVGAIFVLAGWSYRFYENPVRKWGQRVSTRLIAAAAPPPSEPAGR